MDNTGPAVAGMLCALLVAVPIGLWIGALILRAAVGWTNAVLGSRDASDLDFYDGGDYRFSHYPRPQSRGGLATQVPSVGQGMIITLATTIVGYAVQMGLMFAAGVGAGASGADQAVGVGLAVLISIPVGFVVNAGMLAAFLPTSFGRACLVVVFQFVITLLIGAVLLAGLLALGMGLR